MTDPGQIDDYFDDWIDCWDCGGKGYHPDICQCDDLVDTCCCAQPTPRRCTTCKGEGRMNDDLIERLTQGRTIGSNLKWTVTDIHREAADEITALRAKLREANLQALSDLGQAIDAHDAQLKAEAERDELRAAKWAEQHTDTMNTEVEQRMVIDQQHAEITALRAECDQLREALRMPVELRQNNLNASPAELWMSWIDHPAGYKSARAALTQEDEQ